MLKPGVKRKFLMGTIAIVLGVGLAMTLVVRAVISDRLHANHEKRGTYIAAAVARDSANPVLTERYFELQMMLNDLKAGEDEIAYLFVQQDSGEVLAHTFSDGFPDDLKNLRTGDPDSPGKIMLESARGRIYDFSAPLFHGVGGRVHVGLLEDPIRQEMNHAFMLVLGGVFAAVAMGSGLAVLLAASITKPIHLLAVAVEGLEKGKLHFRVPVRSNDEIGRLAASFNSMAESRERAESELRDSEHRWRSITASLGEGVLVADVRGQVTIMNPAAERILGWSENELVGRSFHDIVHVRMTDGKHFPAAECPSLRVVATGEQMIIDDDIYLRKDGTEVPVAHITAPILDEGRIIGVVTAFQDITQRKKREAEREQLMMEHLDTLSKVKVLSGMLPICSSCKKVRDDAGYWKQIEAYITEHSDAEFSHGICPECSKRLYPDYYKKMK